jgi:hypothetical protein
MRQPVLKPQDVLVLLKISARLGPWSFAELADELGMSASEVHAAIKRSELSRLVSKTEGQWSVSRQALLEFVQHGVRYAFPALVGALTRGMATSSFAPPLKEHFALGDNIPLVWPDPAGELRGASLIPLYPSVVAASKADPTLYELLALTDAIRVGAARERELAISALTKHLS